MDNQQATDFDLGWLAGIIDGEGWLGFSLYRNTRAPQGDYYRQNAVKLELKITNCDEAIIERASRIMEMLGVNPYRRMHKQLSVTRRPVHECAIKNMTNVEKILRHVLIHLTGNKQERAKLMLRFIELRTINPGAPNPNYSSSAIRPGKSGRHGPGRIRPYTAEEMGLIERCRDLQSRGASETTRESRERAIGAVVAAHARMRDEISHSSA